MARMAPTKHSMRRNAALVDTRTTSNMRCTGAKSVKKCDRCLKTEHCAEGLFCCPRTKVCMGGSRGCFYNPTLEFPFAGCDPYTCQEWMDQESCSCDHADFPDKWTGATCQGNENILQ